MKREVFEPFPKVERIVEFSEEDIRENTCVTSVDESLITDKNWQEFADNALVFTACNTVYQYAEEFPIVVYRCSEDAMVMPKSRLNSFIRSITVSTADRGKRFSLNKRNMEWEYTGPDTVAYFTKILANALKFCSMIFLDFCCVNQISLFQMKACWFSLQREIFWLHVIAISTHGFTVLIPTTA